MKALYPGSFDPISNGHLDIIKRASKLFDELHIVVSHNINKKNTFTVEERVNMIKTVCKDIKNVKVTSYDGLIVKYALDNSIPVIIRGLRNYSDYESEFQLSQYNFDISNKVETILFMPRTTNQFISSSAIKEMVTFGVDISKYVPKELVEQITNKLKNN